MKVSATGRKRTFGEAEVPIAGNDHIRRRFQLVNGTRYLYRSIGVWKLKALHGRAFSRQATLVELGLGEARQINTLRETVTQQISALFVGDPAD